VISFRYHLVSTIAVFLGIVLGVVVGTTALNGAVVGDLRRQVSDLKDENAKASADNKALQAQVGNADVLARTFGPSIVANRLLNTPVVLVSAPNAPAGIIDALAAQVAAAGGKVSGRIQLTRDLVDPRRASDVRSLATSGVHPIGLQLPSTDDAGRLAGSLLGWVLFGKGQPTDLTQVLTGFDTLNMVKKPSAIAPGRLVIFVAPGAAGSDEASAKALLSLASQVGQTGPTVVAGDAASARQGGLIAAIRSDESAKRDVATVDDVDGALGQLTAALVGAEATKGKKGHYGSGAGADALFPDAAQ